VRIVLTSILLASACLAPVFLAAAQPTSPAAPASASGPSEAEIKLEQQKFLADLKTKADRGDKEAAAWYLYSAMVFAPNLDESRAEKVKLQALADSGNALAVEILKHHEIRKIALLPNSTNDQKLAGARSAWALQSHNIVYSLIDAIRRDQNVSAAQLITAAELLRDMGDYKNAIITLEHPVAKKDPAAIGLEGQLMMDDDDPTNSELSEIFIRRAAAAGDQKSIATAAAIDAKNSANAAALFARSNEGTYAARLELAEAYFSGSVPGIPFDLEKAKELAKYVASAPSATKLFRSEFMLGQIADRQGDRKEAFRRFRAAADSYNLDIDMRERAEYLQDRVILPVRQAYRDQIGYARSYMGLNGGPKNIAEAKSAIAKAMAVDFDDDYAEAHLLNAQISESEKDSSEAYRSYVIAFLQSRDDKIRDEALSNLIRLEKSEKADIFPTDSESTKLKEARLAAGLPDYSSDVELRWQRWKSGPSASFTASRVANADDMPSEVRSAINAFNDEIDKASKRFDLAEQLITAANSEIVKIHKGDWNSTTGEGPAICNKLKTALALRSTGFYYLNRGYWEADRIPDKFPQRASAFSTFKETKSAIDGSNQNVNSSGNNLGCWSGNYTGQGDLWLRSGL
jgi:hypothetical protein